MMSSDNTTTPPLCSSKKDQKSNPNPNPNPNPKKSSNSNSNSSSSSKANQQQEVALNCPRCDSPNTKFCYYNNYSLTQPRHFCKTCRRYWTRGGALRNVPIGGGCRKNKSLRSSSSSGAASRLSSSNAVKFFHGISPAVDFQLDAGVSGVAGLSFLPPPPSGIYTNFSNSYPAAENSTISLDPPAQSGSKFVGFNYPLTSGFSVGAPETIGSMNVNSNLASSIESLSSINQDLHWKLQQQRLAMLIGDETQNGVVQKPQPILFQNLEVSKKANDGGGGGGIATEWFFGNSYEAATNGGNVDQGGVNWNNWGDLQHQYSGLP